MDLTGLPPYLVALAALVVVGLILWWADGPERERMRRLRRLRGR
jgi:hypothetical protein